MRAILLSSPMAQAIASFPGPVGVLVGGLVSTLLGVEEVEEEGVGVSLGGSSLTGVVGEGTGLEDLGLHRLLPVPRFFLAMPWWLGTCLAKWFAWTERARVREGAKEHRRRASVDSAKMLRSLIAGISSEGRQREGEIKSDCGWDESETRKREGAS